MDNRSSIFTPFSFQRRTFQSINGHVLNLGCVDDVDTVDKQKFPLQYFPDSRWSRKGFLRTRWRFGSEPESVSFDLVRLRGLSGL